MQTRLGVIGVILFLFIGDMYAQLTPLEHKYKAFDSQYGLNQMLYNGEKYTPEPTLVKGHPVLYDDQFIESKLILKGQVFEPVMLKYDVYKQRFVLSFSDRNKANQQLVVPNQLIDSIWISDALFAPAEHYGIADGFVQVIESGVYKIVYRWSKDYQFTATKNDIPHVYSDAKRSTYLIHEKLTLKYRTKRSFVKLFSTKDQIPIKNYFKQNKIKFNKVTDSEMIGILIFINSLN